MLMVGTIIGWYKADNEDKVTDFVGNVERGFLYVRTENLCGKSVCTENKEKECNETSTSRENKQKIYIKIK